MTTDQRIRSLLELGKFINNMEHSYAQSIINNAYQKNRWFTVENISYALKYWSQQLSENNLSSWLSSYNINSGEMLNIGIVMAGNIPMVGLHDVICVFLSGNKSVMKLSSKDDVLIPFLITQLGIINPETKKYFQYTDRIESADAIIATGSNNTSVHFEYYFKKYPHIIRKNRNSVAVITGNESQDQIEKLGDDIFKYFGLGCRNVSKLYLPENYDPCNILKGLESYSSVSEHSKYKNNFDYNLTLLLMNKVPHFANDFLILQRSDILSSPVSVLHYEFYQDINALNLKLEELKDEIQCIVTGEDINDARIEFGNSQQPKLNDYADGIDTLSFLLSLN